jgi:restriction endonuclease S subunit
MGTQIVRIMDCAEILPGFSAQGALADTPDGTYQVITGKHVTPGEPYKYKEVDRLRIAPKRDLQRYLLKPGDILYMSRGLAIYPVLLEQIPDQTVAPSTFFILRVRPNVVPAYLIWCLEQSCVEARFAAFRTGAGTPTIPRKGFMEVKVPLPNKATQHRIADFWRLQYRERQIRQKLQDETLRLHRATGQRIFNTLTNI